MDIKNLTGNTFRTEGSTTAKSRVDATAAKSSSATPANHTSDESVTLTQTAPSLSAVRDRTSAVPDESVTLTQTARTLSAVRDHASTVPFDNARVAEIKAAIAAGRYPIDNQRLAERMIQFERLLA